MSERFPNLPATMRRLPVDRRGFPVPWFVAWEDGEPVFPCMDGAKLGTAWQNRLCWVCGRSLHRKKVSVIGPMCAVNRVSSEPPSHLDCARFSALNCPFLTRPRMKRVGDQHLPHTAIEPGGMMIKRNPGVTLLWIEHRMPTPIAANGGVIFQLGRPVAVEFYAEGREATRAEIMHSIETGLPELERQADRDDDPVGARALLARMTADALALVPA